MSLSKSPSEGIRGLSHSDLQVIFSHNVVTFQIGPSRKEYRVSKPLFVNLSHKFSNGFPSGTYGYNNVELVDWSNLIDEEIFSLLVQFAYTGGYDLPSRRDELLDPTNDARRARYWFYQSSPLGTNPCPASASRQHAQIWAFAMLYDITTLAEVATVQLRASLADMTTQHVAHCADLAEDKVREVVDVIGYIYHHGRRFWGNEIKAEAPLRRMRLTIAWFARKYFCDFGNDPSDGRQQQDRKMRVLKMWTDLLEREPRIAVDMVCHDPKTVAW